MKHLLILLLLAVIPPSSDPTIEERARALGETLRCVVCQNQSIEESDADLAKDMRALVRDQLANGKTDAEVTASMRDRYGDFVLLDPPVQSNTYVLWYGPLVFIGVAVVWLFVARRRRDIVAGESLTAEEEARLSALRKSLD